MKQAGPHVSPLPPQGDMFTRVFDGVVRLHVWLLRYLGRRAVQNPLVGLAYAAVGLPSCFLIVQDLRQGLATVGAPRFASVPHMWPLTETLSPTALLALFVALSTVIAFDRWSAYRSRSQSRDVPQQEPVLIEEWVLGRAHRRVWNPDPGEFTSEATGELYRLTEEHLRTHMILVAPTGSGKTRSVLEPALHFFKRTGAAAIYLDAKGDDFDPAQFHLNFDLDRPSGVRLNIWSGRTPREMGERLGEALVPDGGVSKDYFVRNAKDTMAALVDAHHRAYGSMPTLKQLLAYLRSPEARADLAEELRHVGLTEESDEIIDLQRVGQLAEQKNDVLGGLDTALAPLARGRATEMLATGRDGYSIEEIITQPVRARFALAVGHHPRIAPIIGRLVLAQFTYAVISPDCNKGILKAAVVDEADNFISPAIAKGMAMARENRGCYILALQNLMQIENPTLREDLLSVAGNKLVMSGVGDYEAEKFSRLFGSRERPYIAHSQNASQGNNSSRSRGSGREGGDLLGSATGSLRHQSSYVQSASLHRSQGSSSQVRVRAEFLPSEIRNLPQFHVLIERRDSRGGATPATIVNMDYELISGVRDMQALKLYERTGRIEAIAPHLPPPESNPVETIRHPLPHADRQATPERAPSYAEAVLPSPTPDHDSTTLMAAHRTNGPTDAPIIMSTNVEYTGSLSASEVETSDSGSQAPAVAYPEWVEASARRISSLLGLEVQQAGELVREAFRNGRDAAYLEDNLHYVRSAPRVKSKAGLFTFLVKSNQHKTRTRGAKDPVGEATSGEATEPEAERMSGEAKNVEEEEIHNGAP